MSGILPGEWGASAGHNNHNGRRSVADDARHVDVRFDNGLCQKDLVSIVAISDKVTFLNLVEILENGRSMADNEEFVLEALVRASNGGGRDELVIVEGEWFDRGGEIDAGDLEDGVANGFDMACGLEASVEVNR